MESYCKATIGDYMKIVWVANHMILHVLYSERIEKLVTFELPIAINVWELHILASS